MLRAAEDYYRSQALLAAAADRQARLAWSQVEPGNIAGWDPSRLATFMAASQFVAARGADGYTDRALVEQDIDPDSTGRVNPLAFAGVAGDGRSLRGLLDLPRIGALARIGQGMDAPRSLEIAGNSLRLYAVTAVQDAGRTAGGAAVVARPKAQGYVRMLNLPSCSRCAILAGRFYRWSSGFSRHARCDCRHVPSSENLAGDLTTDPMAAVRSGQVTGLSRAEARAITEDGADVAQVVNAQRGMYTAGGRKFTREAASGARLTPEQIYADARGDRAEAVRLLKRFGYLT